MPRKGLPRLDELRARPQQPCLSHGVDAIVEGAHAGQNHGAGLGHFFRAAGDAHVGADLEQGFVDAAQVAGAVIKESYHGPRLCRERVAGNRRGMGRPAVRGWRMEGAVRVRCIPAASAMGLRPGKGWGGVFTPLEPYRRAKPIKTGLFSFSSRTKAVPEPYRAVPAFAQRLRLAGRRRWKRIEDRWWRMARCVSVVFPRPRRWGTAGRGWGVYLPPWGRDTVTSQ